MPRHATLPSQSAEKQLFEYAVDLFYRAADAAVDADQTKRREAAALFALARAVMEAADQPEAGSAPLANAVSCPTARLRAGHASGFA
jgi:hypothetical protein